MTNSISSWVCILVMAPSVVLAHGGAAKGHFTKNPKQSTEWNQGAKLVQETFKCAQCHSPRKNEHEFKINDPLSGFHAPNITQDDTSGIGTWSEKDIAFFLETGMSPKDDSAGGEMVKVIRETQKLSDSDRKAMAVYLKSLKPEKSTMMKMGQGGQHEGHREQPIPPKETPAAIK